MDYFLAIFSNRTETQDFASALRRNRINVSLVSTPSGLGASCGISAKVYANDFSRVMRVFYNQRYLTFVGFYKAVYNGRGGYVFERTPVYLK